MKKLNFLFLFLLLSATLSAPSCASGPVEYMVPEAGIKPDHWLYPVDRFIERIEGGVASVRGPDFVSHVHLTHAGERLAELREMVYNNKTQFIDMLLVDFEDSLDEGRRIAGNRTALLELVAIATAKHQAVLEAVLEDAPESARAGLLNALKKSVHGYEQALESLRKHVSPEYAGQVQGRASIAKNQQKTEEENRKKKRKP